MKINSLYGDDAAYDALAKYIHTHTHRDKCIPFAYIRIARRNATHKGVIFAYLICLWARRADHAYIKRVTFSHGSTTTVLKNIVMRSFREYKLKRKKTSIMGDKRCTHTHTHTHAGFFREVFFDRYIFSLCCLLALITTHRYICVLCVTIIFTYMHMMGTK